MDSLPVQDLDDAVMPFIMGIKIAIIMIIMIMGIMAENMLVMSVVWEG